MIYIKSALVGIVALFVTMIVYIGYAFFVMVGTYTPPPGAMIGLNLQAVLSRPTYWLIALAAFALVFYWEFSRG